MNPIPISPKYFPDIFRTALKDSHKGNFGHVLVVAGSQAMLGAGYLASLGALRAGAGLATYALPALAFDRFDARYPEIMPKILPDDGDGFCNLQSLQVALKLLQGKESVVLGPAMGREPKIFEAIRKTIADWTLPLVLDAEGINAFAGEGQLLQQRKHPTILTPHEGEMATLLGWNIKEVKADRLKALATAVTLCHCFVVLKGYQTLIGTPDGEIFINPTGNSGMATAGSGDVLAGIIAGFVARSIPVSQSLLAAVFLHGMAGDKAAETIGRRGLIASDLLTFFPKAMEHAKNF